MNLTDLPTPETDAMLRASGNPLNSQNHRTILCRDLERRLSACRDLLAGINSSQILDGNIHATISETLTLTAPRP